MLGSRTSMITESVSDYSPAQWIFVSTKITATENAFRAMDLFSTCPTPLLPHRGAQASYTAEKQVQDTSSSTWAVGKNIVDLSGHSQYIFRGKLRLFLVFNSISDGESNSKGLKQFQEDPSRFYHLIPNSKLKLSQDPVSRVAGTVFHVLSRGLGWEYIPHLHNIPS